MSLAYLVFEKVFKFRSLVMLQVPKTPLQLYIVFHVYLVLKAFTPLETLSFVMNLVSQRPIFMEVDFR